MNALMPASSEAPYHVALDDDEWRLIRSLREIPPSPLRDRMHEVIEALVGFVADPGCPELRAEGVPCSRTLLACGRCRRVLSLLDGMRRRLPSESLRAPR